MSQTSRNAVYLGVMTLLIGRSIATTIVQTFGTLSCEPGTASYVYYSEEDAVADTGCKTAPPNTFAIWVDDIASDAGCSIRTYSSDGCADILGLSISPGFCYFQPSIPIRSWRIVCGAQDDDNSIAQGGPCTSEAERAFTIDALLASVSAGNLSSSTTVSASTATRNSSATSNAPLATASNGVLPNSTESATWSNTLTPSSTPTLQNNRPATTSSSNGDRRAGQVSGASSNRKSKTDSVMLVIGSLLGLGWGALW